MQKRLIFLETFLNLLHATLIAFILFGWIFPITRLAHLIVIGVTAFFWIGIGYFVGFGYCPITDAQRRIRNRVGKPSLPDGYVKYLIHRLTRIELKAATADKLTNVLFLSTVVISAIVNIRDLF